MDLITFIAQSGLIGIIFGAIYIAYKEYYKQPELSYQIFSAYSIGSEKIVPIVFRNEGHANATNVLIKISCDGPIKESSQEIPEDFTIEKNDINIIVYKLSRFTKSVAFTTFLKIFSHSKIPVNNVHITSDQGGGQKYKILMPLNRIERIILIIGSIMFGVAITLLILFAIFIRA